jgi:hypothetical protein
MIKPVNTVHSQPRLFDDLPPRDRRPLRGRWWLIAAGAHLALLALPVTWWPRDVVTTEPLVVRLTPSPKLVRPEVPQAEPVLPTAPPPSAQAPKDDPKPASTEDMAPRVVMEPSISDPAIPEPPDENAQKLRIQRLLDAVAAMDWQVPVPPSTLGRTTTSEQVEAMRKPLLPMKANAFDDMTAPAKTEIVDRWLSPGGVHQVVVRGPDGNTYCGRQEAPNDLRPWLQMPMLFHRCAGGGKRGSNASWRNN